MNPSATARTSTSTLRGAIVNSAEGNDFMNIGHDMTKFENVTNLTVNTHCTTRDAISGTIATPNVFVTLATLLIGGIFGRKLEASETHNGNTPQQLTPDDGTRGPSESRASVTEIQDITASTPLSVLDTVNSTISPSTQSSPSERYIRSLLEYNQGYPLYEPELESHEEGIRVGDVGLITEDGGFDFLFNVCPPSDTNPDELPDDFEMLGSPEIQVKAHFQSDTHLFNKEVKRTEEPDIKYTCSGPEGGVLELPLGATRFEAKNKLSFKDLATPHAENWYRYTVLTRGRDAPNGSLYIVTSCIKCTDWGIAVFDRPSNDQDYLRFITDEENQNERSKYRWKGSGAHITKVAQNRGSAGSDETDAPDQCVFLRGYKIMLPGDIWDNISDSESTGTSSMRESPDSPHSGNKSKSPRQGDSSNRDGPSQSRADSGSGSDYGTTRATQNTCNRTHTSARVIPNEHSKSSPAHPSDLINAMLLYQEPRARVALTHDDDWCDLLQHHSKILDSDASAKVSLPYTSHVDEYGCASLKRSDLSPCSNVTVVESSSDTRVTQTSENRLLLSDNRRTNPIHKLPDDLALAQQDHPQYYNGTTKSSTNHSQSSHHLIPSPIATVESDINRPFACDVGDDANVRSVQPISSLIRDEAGPLAATTLPDLRTAYMAQSPEHELPSKGRRQVFIRKQEFRAPFNATRRSSALHAQSRTTSTTATVGSNVNSAFAGEPLSQVSWMQGHCSTASSERPESSQHVLQYPYLALAGSDNIVFDQNYSQMSMEEDNETFEHDYTSSQEPADIELADLADIHLSLRGDEFSRSGDYLRSLPVVPANGAGGATTSTATDQSNKLDKFHLPFDSQSGVAALLPTSWNITNSSPRSPVGSSASGPQVIKGGGTEVNIRTFGSLRIQEAARKRRKKDGIYQCSFTGCEATFTARHNLGYHINTHLGLKPYKCDKCSFAAASPGTAIRHRKTCKVTSQFTEQRVISQSLDS